MGFGIFFQGPYAYPFSVPLPSFWALQIETVYAPFLPHFLQCLLFTQKEHRLLSGAEMSTCLQLRALYYSYLLCPLPVSIYSRGMVQLQAKAGIIFFSPMCFCSAVGIKVNRSSFPVDFKSSRMGCLTISWEHCFKKSLYWVGASFQSYIGIAL